MTGAAPNEWPFPWRKPISHYDTDGPKETTGFEYGGRRFLVTPTGGTGIHTGRDRFRVDCLSCGELLHESTTGPSARVRNHAC